jgi:GalNAc5-diNAcBac-PP-undecaprenol beta-1,3-glucosyltransferase
VTPAPVTVIVPTHDHPGLLGMSVRSVLEQSVVDIDVVVIGDGVGDDTRDVVGEIASSDARVSFLDLPKAGRTGEPHRHRVLSQLASPVVTYHGDDDLLLPSHLATMLDLLDGRDFVCPLPITIRGDGRPQYLPVDLTDPAWVAWHTNPRRPNRISLTGVTHTLASYRSLPFGWRATPPHRATDHYMWAQYLALDGIRAATAHRSTTVKFAGSPRREMSAPDRREEVRSWWDRIHDAGFQDAWDTAVQTAIRSAALRSSLRAGFLGDRLGTRLLRAARAR